MTAPATQRRARSADGQILGVLLVLFGVGWLVRRSGAVDLEWQTILAGLLLLLGVLMVLTARSRGGAPLVLVGVGLIVALAATSSLPVGLDDVQGFGDRVVAPASPAELDSSYSYVFGSMTLDLSTLEDLTDQRTVKARVAFGELVVIVPHDLPVRIEASANAGDVSIFEEGRSSGPSPRETYESDDFDTSEGKVVLDLDVTAGQITVRRPA